MADQEPIDQVFSRTAVVNNVSMWGNLFVNKLSRRVMGMAGGHVDRGRR
jgi:hypothetical protein